MTGTKPEIRKPVLLEDFFIGMNGAYNPDLGTIVKVACETNCYLNGHRAWLISMMPTWIKQLNEYGGGSVISWSIDKSSPNSNFQINLEMFFKGALIKNKLHPKTAGMFSGQMRKMIAMEVIKLFPPPFDVKNPFYFANIPDLLLIELGSCRDSEADNFIAIIKNGDFISEIQKCFEENDAEFIRIFKSSKGFMTYGILFKWKEDVTSKERDSKVGPLRSIFRNKFDNIRASIHRC